MQAHKIQVVTRLGHRYDVECECTRCVAVATHQHRVRRQRRKALVMAVRKTAARKALVEAHERLVGENPEHAQVIGKLYWEAQLRLG